LGGSGEGSEHRRRRKQGGKAETQDEGHGRAG
jgi:hypothetical protein